MMVGAFRGEPQTKRDVLCQLSAGPTSRTAVEWDELGLPSAIPPAIELLARLGDRPDALSLWLEAIEPGASLQHLTSRMLLWMMNRLQKSGFVSDKSDAVAALHERLAAGEEPSRAEWRAARRGAVAATNEKQGIDQLAHGIIEAAAWDPAIAPTVLREALGPWLQHIAATAATRSGWSQADARAMQEIVNDARSSDPAADPLTIVHERAPELLARMDAARLADREATSAAAAAALEALMHLAAKCPQC